MHQKRTANDSWHCTHLGGVCVYRHNRQVSWLIDQRGRKSSQAWLSDICFRTLLNDSDEFAQDLHLLPFSPDQTDIESVHPTPAVCMKLYDIIIAHTDCFVKEILLEESIRSIYDCLMNI